MHGMFTNEQCQKKGFISCHRIAETFDTFSEMVFSAEI